MWIIRNHGGKYRELAGVVEDDLELSTIFAA